MAMKNPSEVNTRHRDEMVCPLCFHDGLEPHPGFIDDYEGDAAVLRATRCPNEECNYHYECVPVDAVDQQYIRTSFLQGLTTDLDASNVLIGLLVLGGMLFLLTNVLGIGIPGLGGGVDVTVEGQVVAADGSPVANASVSVVNGSSSGTTDSNGTYRLANLSVGQHVVSIEPQNDSLAASTVVMVVGKDSSVSISNASNNATLDGKMMNVRVKDSVRVAANKSVANGTFLLNYSNPANAKKNGGVVVRLAPPAGDTVADSVSAQTGTPASIDIPGVLTSQSLIVDTGVVERDVTQTETWDGSGSSSVSIDGNLPPGALTVNVSEDANERDRTVSETVSHGSSFTETVYGSLDGDMTVTIWGGSATAPTTKTGTYSGSNPQIEIDEEAAPAQVSVVVTGNRQTTSKIESGTVQSGSADFTLDGTLPARNAVIEFTGGTPENAQVGDESVSADASGGTQTRQPVLFEASSEGSYRIEYDFTEEQNGDLVEAGYKVNGDLTTVAEGSGQTTLDLANGDTVRLYLKAEQESNAADKNYQRGDHDVYVTDTEVSSTQVQPGELVTVTATMENRGRAYGLDVYLFTDGTQEKAENEYFSGGETKQVTFEVRFSKAGTHTVSVNEGNPITVQVGDGEPRSGAGSMSGTATRLGDGGTVNVDTNGDGTPDQSVAANGGTVSLGSLSAGDHSLVVSQQGVTGTGFEVSYDARSGPSDVTVDIDGDGVPEIDHSGPLGDGESKTGSASVDGGLNPVLFDVGNGGSVDYEIRYTEAGQVTKPKVYMDGELVVDETENFKGERTYTIQNVNAGSHEFRFESANQSNTFNVRLDWSESGDALYPALKLDGETVCRSGQFANDRSCTVSDPGSAGSSLSLAFDGGANSFEYGVTYTARATPERVTVSVNGDTERYLKQALSSRDADGSWKKEASVNLLTPGANQIRVETPTVDGLQPPATASFTYTYRAKKPTSPKVVVVNADNETFDKPVPEAKLDANGYLREEARLSLPAEWFTRGENKVRVVAENGGVVIANVTATTEHDGALRLAPAEDSD